MNESADIQLIPLTGFNPSNLFSATKMDSIKNSSYLILPVVSIHEAH